MTPSRSIDALSPRSRSRFPRRTRPLPFYLTLLYVHFVHASVLVVLCALCPWPLRAHCVPQPCPVPRTFCEPLRSALPKAAS